MEFKPEKVSAFLANFESVKEKIRRFPGCMFLELYADKKEGTIFFTYSRWESENDLQAYRTSALFAEVWATTKPMFRSKAQAWSVDTLHSLT
jgi:quinol monooxygenase YgiN